MIGKTLGNYEIISTLGQGGMGVIYIAEHRLIGRKAAVKVLRPELLTDSDMVTRFFNEARATTRIKHPGLVDIFDFGHFPDGSAYIAMELLEGESLAALLKRQGRLSLAQIVGIGRQVAAALGAAHEKGITHRDLKPDNVFLVPDADFPDGTRVKILDFGIAKLPEQEGADAGSETVGGLTRTGVVMGTPFYMSPEQCKSAAKVDHRSDIYALGCVLYEMVCGRPPFVRASLGETIAAHLVEEPQSLRSLVPSASAGLERVILRALAKRPEERQPSIIQLRAELWELVSDGAIAGASKDTRGGMSPVAAPQKTNEADPELHVMTMGSANGQISQIGEVDQPPKSRVGLVVGVAIAAAAVIAVAVLRSGANGVKENLSSSVHETSVKPASANSLPVTIRLELDPLDARLTLDGKPVAGSTIELSRGAPSPLLRAERPGYVGASMPLPTNSDQTINFRLMKEGAGVSSTTAAPVSASPEKTPAKVSPHHAAKPSKGKKAGLVGDGVIDDYQ